MAEASSTTPARLTPPSRASERQVWKSTACHTDSAEEILYIVAGEGEARLGDERGPVQAGDLLTATLTVDSLRQIGGADIIGTRSEIVDGDGLPVCTALATLVHRGEDA